MSRAVRDRDRFVVGALEHGLVAANVVLSAGLPAVVVVAHLDHDVVAGLDLLEQLDPVALVDIRPRGAAADGEVLVVCVEVVGEVVSEASELVSLFFFGRERERREAGGWKLKLTLEGPSLQD